MPRQKIKVDGFEIGGEKTFIIAEIGSNHAQSLKLAYETIDAAVECGANAVKFQSINIKELYYRPSKETIELHKKIDLDEGWHQPLKNYCDKKKITFFSSPTYLKAVDILEGINVQLYKLASAQIGTFPQIVEKVALTKKPVILSTGLVTKEELENVIRIFSKAGNDKFVILHCNSIYPTPYERVGLRLMEAYRKMFGCIVGFSDHTEGAATAIAAVALGAKVIEKHFVLKRNIDSPDAPLSMEPPEFKELVSGIRAAEAAVTEKLRTEIEPEERKFKERILYKLILKKNKKKNDPVSKNDFEYRRTSGGIDCRDVQIIFRKKYKTDLAAGKLLKHSDFN